MGAWGYQPEDNDTAADWFGNTMGKSKLPSRIERGLRSKDEDEVRAAAFLLEQVGYVYIYDVSVLTDHLALAIEKLHGILHDKAWIENWRDSNAIKRSLRKQIKELKVRLRTIEDGDRVLAELEKRLKG